MRDAEADYWKVTLGTDGIAYERTCRAPDRDAAIARARRAARQAWSVILTPVGVDAPVPEEFLQTLSVERVDGQGDGFRQMGAKMKAEVTRLAAEARDKGKPFRTPRPYVVPCSVEEANDAMTALAEIVSLWHDGETDAVSVDVLVDAGHGGASLSDCVTVYAQLEVEHPPCAQRLDPPEALVEAAAAIGTRLVSAGQFRKSERWFGHTFRPEPSATLRAARRARKEALDRALRHKVSRYLAKIGDSETAREILPC